MAGRIYSFHHLPVCIVEIVLECIFFVSKKKKKKKEKHRHTYKEKGEETKKDWLVVNFEIYSDTFPLVNFKSIMADVQLVEFRYIY